jgi:hypothetical protein
MSIFCKYRQILANLTKICKNRDSDRDRDPEGKWLESTTQKSLRTKEAPRLNKALFSHDTGGTSIGRYFGTRKHPRSPKSQKTIISLSFQGKVSRKLRMDFLLKEIEMLFLILISRTFFFSPIQISPFPIPNA